MPMRNSAHEAQNGEGQPEGLLRLTLERLFATNQTLVVNPAIRTVTLISSSADGEAQIIAQQQFSPNGMRVLIPLLQAYPDYCPYEVLLANLCSLSLDEARRQLQDMWVIAIRQVRRAINSLKAGLAALGLRVRTLLNAGYRVEARTKKHPIDASSQTE